MQIYLSGPIIHKHLRRDEFYKKVTESLEMQGHGVFTPQFMPPTDARAIYERDFQWVMESDLILAEVSKPSLGVGMELMLAVLEKKPVLAFYEGNIKMLSKMVRGADGITVIEYSNTDEVIEFITQHDFESMVLKKCSKCQSWILEKRDNSFLCILCDTEVPV
ncbi:MAG: hypothetical protein GF411_11355 [Candidatus Lokiarchaeota archaeon]|nr:hypothetical protein [Candidatus Lokiarchaeota archaeon]